MRKHEKEKLIEYIFEAGVLAKTPRSGLWHLGTGKQSVAEHSFRVAAIGYMLAHLIPKANPQRVLEICLFHDFHEARTSDLNLLHKKYSVTDEKKAFNDAFKSLPAFENLQNIFEERKLKVTLESKISKDADILEWIAFLVEQKWNGNLRADYWLSRAMPNLATDIAQEIASKIVIANPDGWWRRNLK